MTAMHSHASEAPPASDKEKPGLPPNRGSGLRIDTTEVPERIREIAMLRGLGFTFREIGESFGVSAQAVSLMLVRHRRMAKTMKKTFHLCSLSARAVNVLGRHRIRTREEALAGDLLERLPNERNCGKKTREEIERWLAGKTE